MNGPKVLFEIPLFGGIKVTESIVNMWIIMAALVIVSVWLTHGMRVRNPSKKQLVAEKLITMLYNLVKDTMGEKYMSFAPYIGTLFIFSIVGSLSSLTGLRPITADLSVILSWSIVTFLMIQVTNIKNHGVLGWLKSFTEGLVITSLVYGGLASLSSVILSWIPNDFFATIPILQVGIPAILSVYFDLFTSFLQAYIICMLTMVFVQGAGD